MDDLLKELTDMITVFNQDNIPVEKQRDIISSGVEFDFTNDKRVKFILFCHNVDPTFNTCNLLNNLLLRRDDNYKNIVGLFLQLEEKKDKQLSKKL